jgi:hypothetical protein
VSPGQILLTRLGDMRSTSAPYLDFCNELCSIFAEGGFAEANRQEIIALVNVVKNCQAVSIEDVMETSERQT